MENLLNLAFSRLLGYVLGSKYRYVSTANPQNTLRNGFGSSQK